MPGSKSLRGKISDRLSVWQKELLDQRLKDAEEHPEDWVSWDEARQRLERQVHGHE